MNEKETSTTVDFNAKMRTMLELQCEQINAAWGVLRTQMFALEARLSEITPMESSAYKRAVLAHNARICDLQEAFNTFIVTTSETRVGHLPTAEKINIKQTMIRYGKGF